jgi:uracil-DNA glycosylase
VTNAVKHFKFEQRGKRRMHKHPARTEVVACRAWLESEIAVIQPRLIVCFRATAAQSLLGPKFRITLQRGELVENPWAPALMATYHPSAILRAPEKEDRDHMRDEFKADLQRAVEHLANVQPTLKRLLPRRPVEWAAAQEVEMEMIDALPGLGTVVDDYAVAFT